MKFFGGIDADRGEIHKQCLLRRDREQPVRACQCLVHLGARREHRDDDLRAGRRVCRRRVHRDTGGFGVVGSDTVDVKTADVVSCLHQVERHRHPHLSEADPCNYGHLDFPSSSFDGFVCQAISLSRMAKPSS
jgi:hypothetical protein